MKTGLASIMTPARVCLLGKIRFNGQVFPQMPGHFFTFENYFNGIRVCCILGLPGPRI
jgi:hypothetical protein